MHDDDLVILVHAAEGEDDAEEQRNRQQQRQQRNRLPEHHRPQRLLGYVAVGDVCEYAAKRVTEQNHEQYQQRRETGFGDFAREVNGNNAAHVSAPGLPDFFRIIDR